jgi:hypothetical protein
MGAWHSTVIEELLKVHIEILPYAEFYSLCAAFPNIALSFMFLVSKDLFFNFKAVFISAFLIRPSAFGG